MSGHPLHGHKMVQLWSNVLSNIVNRWCNCVHMYWSIVCIGGAIVFICIEQYCESVVQLRSFDLSKSFDFCWRTFNQCANLQNLEKNWKKNRVRQWHIDNTLNANTLHLPCKPPARIHTNFLRVLLTALMALVARMDGGGDIRGSN